MNAQPHAPLSLDCAAAGYRAGDTTASAAPAVSLPEAQAGEPPLSWKQRLFVVALFVIALLVSIAVVRRIDPPAAALYNSAPHAAAPVAGSSRR